jgi:hypothetical protein
MFPSFILLIHLAWYNVVHGTLDIGPARVDVDVFMSLDHQTSSTLSSASFTSTTITVPLAGAPAEYPEPTESPFHPYSKATSYVASVWNELDSALQDSGTSTSTSDFGSSVTSFIVATTTTPSAGAPTEYPEPTESPLHPYSKATSYAASVWNELDSALHHSETSTLDFVSLATSAVYTDKTTCTDSPTVQSPRSSMIDLPQYSDSAFLTSRRAYDGSVAGGLPLFASTAGSTSCNSSSSRPPNVNATSTWLWPSVVSAWPSPSTHTGNSTQGSSPIIQSGSAGGKPPVAVWASWVVGALIMAAEARSML